MELIVILFDEPGEVFIDGKLGGSLDKVDGEESELFIAIFFILATSSFLGI